MNGALIPEGLGWRGSLEITQRPCPGEGCTEQSRRAPHVGREGESTTPPQPVPVLCHPQSKSVFPHIQLEIPVFQCVPPVPCRSEFPGRPISPGPSRSEEAQGSPPAVAPAAAPTQPAPTQPAPRALQGFEGSSVKFILKNINLFFHLRAR